MAKHTIDELKQWQALPLGVKIGMTKNRIRMWVNEYGQEGCYVSFSGGKDSTVLLDLVRNECGYDKIPAVFVDVPTQYPELRDFVKTFDNVVILKPKISFMEVCEKYGFPLISKEVSECVSGARTFVKNIAKNGENVYQYQFEKLMGPDTDVYQMNCRLAMLLGVYEKDWGKKKAGIIERKHEISTMFSQEKYKFFLEAPFEISNQCCNVMKKDPVHRYAKETGRMPITAQMADESRLRTQKWLQNGCNAFDIKNPISNPMSFWTENDVLQYIAERNLPICSVYGDVVEDYGEQVEGQLSFVEYEKKYKTTGCKRTGCMLCGFGCHLEKSPNRFEMLKETHPKMYALLDIVKNNGVTMREAIDWVNEHGNMNIKY